MPSAHPPALSLVPVFRPYAHPYQLHTCYPLPSPENKFYHHQPLRRHGHHPRAAPPIPCTLAHSFATSINVCNDVARQMGVQGGETHGVSINSKTLRFTYAQPYPYGRIALGTNKRLNTSLELRPAIRWPASSSHEISEKLLGKWKMRFAVRRQSPSSRSSNT
ncbi:hypothetical protein BD779DRAFT_1538992 [Infundibulicybe gibba]|nr:hypothetical protein BD779DRAFT_1538992 [Infundibulicybe gibba]